MIRADAALDARGFEPWDMTWRDTAMFEELSSHIDPADRDRVRSACAATLRIRRDKLSF